MCLVEPDKLGQKAFSRFSIYHASLDFTSGRELFELADVADALTCNSMTSFNQSNVVITAHVSM